MHTTSSNIILSQPALPVSYVSMSGYVFLIHLFLEKFYLFIFRERGREGEREEEK